MKNEKQMANACPRCSSEKFRETTHFSQVGRVFTSFCPNCGLSNARAEKKEAKGNIYPAKSDIKPVLLQAVKGLKVNGKLVIEGILQGNIPVNKQGLGIQSFDRILITKESQCEQTKNIFLHGKAWLNNIHYYIIFRYEKKKKVQTEESF